ncbi:uncharacterized protein [Dendropsophus ebraccatus]|uniref:uncharacterized protein n=1 Tax=Dendropsophus ebraccatus TaxID=150705 RepID=UPI00383130ED
MLKMWFSNKWLPEIKKWAHCYRSTEQNIGINTNNGLERQHQTLKHCYLDSYKNSTLSQLIRVLHFGFFPETYDKYVQLNLLSSELYRKYDVKVPKFLQNRPRDFICHVMQRFYSDLEKDDIKMLDEQCGIFEVRSENDKNKVYSVCVGAHGPSCTCKDWEKFLMPCKHICAVIRFTGFTWDKVNQSYQKNPLFCLDDDCLDSKSLVKVEETEGTENTVSVQNRNRATEDLPPRKRSKKTFYMKKCLRGIKQTSDLIYLVKEVESLKLLYGRINELNMVVRENIAPEVSLALVPFSKTIVPDNIHQLPERKYGRPKQRDIHRVGLKADQKKEELWENLSPEEEEEKETTTDRESEVWLTINGIKLTQNDRAEISGGEWLDDKAINVAQYLIKKKKPQLDGLIDTLILSHNEFKAIINNHAVQIHHVGAHWLISVLYNSAVYVYDSMPSTTVCDTLKKQIIKLYQPLFRGVNKSLDVKIICVQKQKGAQDCGLYAIANATAIAEGVNLRNLQFVQSEMRSHLVKCFEIGCMSMFPHEMKNKLKKNLCTKISMTLYCFCHLYEQHEPMVECYECKQWFHFKCVGITQNDVRVKTKKRFYCNVCKKA